MSEKHQIFIESMVKMSKVSPDYVEPLKAITKCYVINEGLDFSDIKAKAKGYADKMRTFADTAKERIMKDPAKVEIPDQNGITKFDEALLEIDKRDFNKDYGEFMNVTNKLTTFLRIHGTQLFHRLISSPEFKNALKRGEYLDSLKQKTKADVALAESVNKAMQFVAVLESVASMGYRNLAKGVYDAYFLTESTFGVNTKNLFESSFSAMEAAELAEQAVDVSPDEVENKFFPFIEKCIIKHGRSLWERYLKSENFKWAVAWGNIMDGEDHMRTDAYGSV